MRIVAALLLTFWISAAAAQDGVGALCGGEGAAPPAGGVVRVWPGGGTPEAESWRPPPCIGWSTPGFRLLVLVGGTFRHDGDPASLLARFGAVSALSRVRFWAPSDEEWRPIVERAVALAGPGSEQQRGDFTAAELMRGGDLYFQQGGGRAGDVVYRMRVLEARPDRIVVSTENVTPVKILLVTLFSPGELQSVYVLDRRGAGEWSYQNLTRTGPDSSSLTKGRSASVVNRAVALARHFTGTDLVREPGPTGPRP